MGVRGARRGNTAQQIEAQTKTAASALLAVMNLLQRKDTMELSQEWASYFTAIGRRFEWVRNRTSIPAAASSPFPAEPAQPIDTPVVARKHDLLAQAIANAAIKSGIIDGTQPLTGPQLLMLCDDLVTAAQRSPEERNFIDASVAVWREIDKGGPPLDSSIELRKRERAAWERYRAVLDTTTTSPDETVVGGEAQTFRTTKEAMEYAQRNNIPTVIPVVAGADNEGEI